MQFVRYMGASGRVIQMCFRRVLATEYARTSIIRMRWRNKWTKTLLVIKRSYTMQQIRAWSYSEYVLITSLFFNGSVDPTYKTAHFLKWLYYHPSLQLPLCSTEPFSIFSRKLFSAKQTKIWINPQYTHSGMSSPVAWLVLSLFHVIYSLFSCFILKPSSFQLLHFQPLFPACGIAYPTLISFTCPSLTFPP